MDTRKYRADLHVHSQHSNRPTIWAMRRFNCPESYTVPQKIYDLAKKRGMDYVTITDHNSIKGALEIAHLPGTLLGVELTSYFPENGCKVHVGVLGFTEAQFSDLMVARKNVYELVDHLRSEDLAHFLAHPLYDVNGKLSLEMVEKFLLVFNTFEVRNGGRAKRYNDLLEQVVNSLNPEIMDLLADKHGIQPYGDQPWIKGRTGGSDDHSGLYAAQTYTECSEGATIGDFLQSIKNKTTVSGGECGTPLTLAHSIYTVGYHFFSRQLAGRKLKSYPFLGALLQRMFAQDQGLSRSARLKLAMKSALPEIYPNNNRSRPFEEILDREIRQLLSEKSFREQLGAESLNRRVFAVASHLANRLLYHYTDKLLSRRMDGGIMDLVNSFSTIGFVHLASAPYYIAHHRQNRGKALLGELTQAFGLADAGKSKERMALFTDTLSDINGVALTIKRFLQAAPEHGADLVVVSCSNAPTSLEGNIKNFQAIGDLALPEYPEIKLHFPPILDILDFIAEGEFDSIHVSTPGPLGLLGMMIAKLTDLPLGGTYHTDFPQFVGRLTADQFCEDSTWNYMIWFYNQLDQVLVPSRATRDQLLRRGLSPEKPRPLPRWVDTDRFSPAHSDPSLWKKLGADVGVKILYAGRVSREKNLEVLVAAFRELEASGADATLVVAGDGPYRVEMERELHGSRTVFTGFLPQDELAKIYASADIFVFPSTTDTFGNVVLEAQASGLPAIVTDEGGPQELILPGRSGLVVSGGEVEALRTALQHLVEAPKIRAAMARESREFALRGRLDTSVQYSTLFGARADWSWVEEATRSLTVDSAA